MNSIKVLSSLVFGMCLALTLSGCSTGMPSVRHKTYEFPKEAFMGEPNRPYEKLGLVKARSDFVSISADDDDQKICKNYFNDSVRKLVDLARDQGGDAVMQVRSVVYLLNGKTEQFPRAECAEENGEGQNLAMGIAIKWKPDPKELEKK